MMEKIQILIGFIVFPLLLTNLIVIVVSWFVSRILFNRRLKLFHRSFWEKLVNEELSAPNFLFFDATPAIKRFRLHSIEDFSDQKITLYRKFSIISLKLGLWMLLTLMVVVPVLVVLLFNS